MSDLSGYSAGSSGGSSGGGSVTGTLVYKGTIDASSNPNYPAGTQGDVYKISVAGKIGGASGSSVDAGDQITCITNNAGGTQGSVGTSWNIVEHNLVGALLSANNLSDIANPATARGNLSAAPIASPTFTGIVTAPEYTASGLTGATAQSRYVGATASGAPVSGTFVTGDWIVDQTGKIWICTAGGTSGTWAQVAGSGGGSGVALFNVVQKAANYNLVASDLALYDTTSASYTATLPTTPADKTRIALKMITQGSTNTVTVACGGSDTINKAGTTSYVMKLLGEAVTFVYDTASTSWIIISVDIPLSQLDLRYQAMPLFFDNGNGSTAATINFNSGSVQKLTLNSASCALTLTAPTNGKPMTLRLHVYNTSTFTTTWVTTVLCSGGVKPVATTGTAHDVWIIDYDGTSFYVANVLPNVS